MDASEIFFVVVRWVHEIAAVTWVGGSIFFAIVIRPINISHPEIMAKLMVPLSSLYRDLVDLSIIALIVSGLILTVNRLTDERTTASYGIVLGLKILVALFMFYLVWELRRSGYQPRPGGWHKRISWLLGYNALAALGVGVFLMVEFLRPLYERSVGVAP